MTENSLHEIHWEKIRLQNSSSSKPYSSIAKVLVEQCFTNEVSVIEEILLRSLPLLDVELRRAKPGHRKLKIAMDVGKSTGLNNIGLLNREDEHRLLFETALIVLLYFDEELYRCPYSDLESLLSNYPEFKKCDERELKKLLNFANFMDCAIRLLPAKGKKSHLLDMVTRITEGHRIKYVTGGGQTISTALRVLIYEREGGVAKSQRAARRADWISLPQVLPNSANFIDENLILHGMQCLPLDSGEYNSVEANHTVTNKNLSSGPSVSSPRSKRTCHRSVGAVELTSYVTLSCAVGSGDDNDIEYNTPDDNRFLEENLKFFEKPSQFNGLSFTTSMSSENGKMYRNIFIARMAPTTDFLGKPNSLSNRLDLLASTALELEVENSDMSSYENIDRNRVEKNSEGVCKSLSDIHSRFYSKDLTQLSEMMHKISQESQ